MLLLLPVWLLLSSSSRLSDLEVSSCSFPLVLSLPAFASAFISSNVCVGADTAF